MDASAPLDLSAVRPLDRSFVRPACVVRAFVRPFVRSCVHCAHCATRPPRLASRLLSKVPQRNSLSLLFPIPADFIHPLGLPQTVFGSPLAGRPHDEGANQEDWPAGAPGGEERLSLLLRLASRRSMAAGGCMAILCGPTAAPRRSSLAP